MAEKNFIILNRYPMKFEHISFIFINLVELLIEVLCDNLNFFLV